MSRDLRAVAEPQLSSSGCWGHSKAKSAETSGMGHLTGGQRGPKGQQVHPKPLPALP